MLFEARDCEIKLWKKVEMPERKRNDKGVFEKTGGSTEMTGYIIHDEYGSELYIISADSQFRTLQNVKGVTVQLDGSYDDYGRKNKFKLVGIIPPAKAK